MYTSHAPRISVLLFISFHVDKIRQAFFAAVTGVCIIMGTKAGTPWLHRNSVKPPTDFKT